MSLQYDSFFIGGQWVAPQGSGTIKVVSASTEEPLGSVPEAIEADVDAAVDGARRAFDDPSGWAHWEPARRAEVMERLADALDSRSEEMARRVSSQNGMPVAISSQFEAGFPSVLLRYYAGLAREASFSEERAGLMGGRTLVQRKPIGVVGAIVPWNFPQSLAFFKIAPALAAGCAMVVKPSPETVLDTFLLAEAVEEAGVPAGVLNFVPGGRELGAYLVSHPRIDKVAFTGSTAAGRSIAETCGRLLRPVTLELGGKSASIVLDDADLSQSMEQLFSATLLNNGQTCFVGTRILAPKNRYDEIVQIFSALAGGVSVGDALDPATQIGPMASSAQRDRVEGYIAKGVSEGGKIAAGGKRPEQFDHGWFVSPTVFAGLDNNATIAQEEIFGPVLTVIPYENDDDAVRIANDSDFGLGGSVWTSDPARGRNVAARVRTGSIGINAYLPDPTAPFGGVKASGMGRELGPEGLAAYQELQSIYLDPSEVSAP
ncbi:MAG TPA: aldehyde dehydrogenase [Actinomycetospora sp.]|jgi:acyl-CoA reductase-like NAD-dependent aldehyde dehydrogenase|uniref:aldehyde dehydrogenase n=1 Tax=Actinomycetospora sp. TaxID=1872135 RepID=UPI002F4223A3